MDSFALKCFGVGDGWACADRNHSSFLYRIGHTSFLIDCGEPASRMFKASGLGYDSIDHIFLSHFHFDHAGGFFMLMQGFWLEQRKKDLPIHLPGYGIGPIRQMLHTGCIFDELLPFRALFTPIMPRQPVLAGPNLRVTAFPTTHLESLRAAFQHKYPHTFEAYSFLIEAGQRRIAHSADIGAPEDLDPLLEKPVDLLVCELAHFQPEDLFRYLQGKPIGRILFIHLARPLWERLEQTRQMAERMLPGIPLGFARDGEELSLP